METVHARGTFCCFPRKRGSKNGQEKLDFGRGLHLKIEPKEPIIHMRLG